MKYNVLLIILMSIVSCSSPKPRKPISKGSSTFLNKSISRNKLINKQQEDFFRKRIKNDSLHHYKKSQKGFWYYIEKKANEKSGFPKKGDEVVINYEIKDVNNNIIYSKEELGSKNQKEIGDRLYKVDGENFITGLQEGIKLMQLGETVTFLFPSYKVFGVKGFRDRIKPDQPLIITVYLKEIRIKKNNK